MPLFWDSNEGHTLAACSSEKLKKRLQGEVWRKEREITYTCRNICEFSTTPHLFVCVMIENISHSSPFTQAPPCATDPRWHWQIYARPPHASFRDPTRYKIRHERENNKRVELIMNITHQNTQEGQTRVDPNNVNHSNFCAFTPQAACWTVLRNERKWKLTRPHSKHERYIVTLKEKESRWWPQFQPLFSQIWVWSSSSI